MNSTDPIPLGYAPPTLKTRARRGQERWAAVIPVIVGILFLAFVIPGSSSTEPELAFAAMVVMWIPAAIYLWLRIAIDFPDSKVLAAWILFWSTVVAVTLLIQLSWWFNDPGFPNPRFRMPIIIPGLILCAEIAVGLLGGVMIRKAMLRRAPVG